MSWAPINSKKYRELRRKWRAPIVRWILTGSTRRKV